LQARTYSRSEKAVKQALQQLYMYIPYCIYIHMAATAAAARKVKLQKVGNSLRATIPKDVAERLSLKEGDTVNIMTAGDDDRAKIVIEKVEDDMPAMAKFYGALMVKEVRKWPSPEEIKSIWE